LSANVRRRKDGERKVMRVSGQTQRGERKKDRWEKPKKVFVGR